ncbi:MAG: acyl-CoA dehydrogenase family protein [Actinomycetota bacterium]|uniref:Acyl-CoA dehydrogenase family protein n=1 Tax=Mycobacterium lentiflavum TaxID=141349 RepID=A0ABY3UYT4_MYCLN|nr:acyl-CoA dehydrogenase family protein [Mycobacterium lentiflavum]MEE3066052.1 acyl-CoA dehydrogenase family protein [Actinomycetota bacterium]ULP44732.1 acyl-CoA dehydrogenase family protein [Mycobacterium lentiflavum]
MTAAVDGALVDMMAAVFAGHREKHPPTTIVRRDPDLWRQLDELGLVRLTGNEQNGGSGATWFEAAELLTAAVGHGVRIPLAEHDLLACWLLDATGMPVGDAVRTVCVLDKRGAATQVPWAASADRVVLVWRSNGQHRVADVARETLAITPGFNLIGEPRDTVDADLAAADGAPVGLALITQLRLKSGLVRSIQVCAALDRILQLCIEHVTARAQFGRPLAKFQAVQNLVSDIATEAALARAATEAALSASVAGHWSGPDLGLRVAVARSCAGHAASVVVRNAHQVHGAIGTTREHRLHEFTRAALAWRSEFGSVRYWDEQVTDAALYASAGGLWSLITG